MKTRQRFWGLGLKKQVVILGLVGLSFLTGCATPSQAPYLWTGAGLGAALGAGLGAAINHNNPWRGAAIGGLLGSGRGWRGRSSSTGSRKPLISRNRRGLVRRPASSRVIISRPPIMGLRPAEPPARGKPDTAC